MSPVHAQIIQAHQMYCQLTGQQLRLDYVRERQWYELLTLGHTVEQVRQVILYLQREIREKRRNVGALKLSNLLQPDRFEEDLNIRQVKLRSPSPPPAAKPPTPSLPPDEQERRRQAALDGLRKLKQSLR
jgi:hypothetical protein